MASAPPSAGKSDLAGIPARYEPISLLGHGGGGAVWKARDRATGGPVAIKLLHRGGGAAEADALLRESVALSGLEGLGLPRLLRLGRTLDGRPYLIRELVDGEGLDIIASEQPRRVPALLCEVADALTVVHRASLLHGDVKPANVIVRACGGVSLVDLGLATALREGGGFSAGLTPHFAAPEVRHGGALTPQSEVFSLGVMLSDHLEDYPELLTPTVMTAVDGVAQRATSISVAGRFPSSDEFAQALRLALGGDAPPAGELATPWPVRGMEATAYGLERAIETLPSGGLLRVAGAPGAGTSTLLRRLAWSASIKGGEVGYADEQLDAVHFREEAARASLAGGLFIVDVEGEAPWEIIAEARSAGARVVVSERVAAGGDGADGVHFCVPPLPLAVVKELLFGALPGLSDEVVLVVAERTDRRPGALRAFVERARDLPVAGREDVEAILAGEGPLGCDPLLGAQLSLERGHFAEARVYLDRIEARSPRSLWLAARFELAAGSPAEALALGEAALALMHSSSGEPASNDVTEPQLRTTCARAVLGLGRYAEALVRLEGAEGFSPLVASEALAYRGLCQTLLGDGEAARGTLDEAVRRAEATGSDRVLALGLSCRATAEWRGGNSDGAVLSYQQAIAAATRSADAGMLASALINLAGLRKERGELAEAIRALESALDAARRSGRQASLHQALLNLSNADLYLGRLERARAELTRVGSPETLGPVLRAQLHGLWAELLARSGATEESLQRYADCEQAWSELGRKPEAAEAALEGTLVAAGASDDEPGEARFVATHEQLRGGLERGRQFLDGQPTALLRLAEARVSAREGENQEAERQAQLALDLAQSSGQKDWAWRALALQAELADAAGKHTHAAHARERAVEVLEDIAARLPEDLRTVFWNEPRRAFLRGAGTMHSLRAGAVPTERGGQRGRFTGAVAARSIITRSGTDTLSRMSQTPLERRLARILAINSDLAGEVELPRLAEKIVAHAAELLGAERGYLLLGTRADALVVCASRAGQGQGHEDFSRSIARQVLETGSPLVSVDVGVDRRLQAFESVHLQFITAVVCVPILSPGGAPIGALYLETRAGARPDFGDEVPTIQAFAEQAAIALESQRLLAELADKTRSLAQQNAHLREARARLKESLGKRTARLHEVRRELRTTREKFVGHSAYAGLVGSSPAMRRIYQLIERIKDTDVPVLITGESGTGKEMVARAIHQGSVRGKAPLVAVNCGAIPMSILESELFGHVRGAFTGADRERRGLFREADGGVLLLDEIGETPLKMQAGLLRVLQERKVRPVGGTEETPFDVRVIFATNRNLEEAVLAGLFREDLLYRIRVVELALPPLRERREDIPLLIDHFLERMAARFGQPKKNLSRDAQLRILAHPLPGNVRQLENVLLNAWVLSEGDHVEAEDIELPSPGLKPSVSATPSRPSPPSPRRKAPGSARATLSEHQRQERSQMARALEESGWNRVRAAQLLGMPRRTFYRRLKDYGLQR